MNASPALRPPHRFTPERRARLKQYLQVRAHGVTVERGPVRIRFCLPVSVLWALLAPVALLALPIVAAIALPRRQNPFALLAGVGAVLFALSGTLVEIEGSRASVKIRLI